MHKFDPAHAHRLDNPERARWQDPQALIRALGVRPGMVCVDVGAGTGYFALPLAAAVGPEGHVYAVDVSQEMLKHLDARLGGIENVSPLLSEEARLPLADASADLVLVANVFHELSEPAAVLAEVRRVLRPGGRVAVMDWRKGKRSDDEPGPPADHRVPAEDVAAALAGAGLATATVETTHFPYHYLLTGSKAAA